MAGLGLVHSLYRAHRAVVPATARHLVGPSCRPALINRHVGSLLISSYQHHSRGQFSRRKLVAR